MTEDIVIQASGLGKRYRTGLTEGVHRYGTVREELAKGFGRRRKKEEDRTYWALRDISLSIARGERVGVIGRNGAGKSTLLKVLARVTTPTEGRVEMLGRVGALLEVGTGFHPELSGRDNVHLSGAILGMQRAETMARLDDIVDFAGVGQFIDTPVKRYSSGMYLRLAFSVAAHLEPDILLVDEVLAVGDAEFQKKCLGRMAEVGREGRTVVFVSHSMPAVTRLCERVVLLDGGHLVADGRAHEVVRQYLNAGGTGTAQRTWTPEAAPGDSVARLRSVRVLSGGDVTDEVAIDRDIEIEVEYEQLIESGDKRPVVDLSVYNEEGTLLFVTMDSSNRRWRTAPRTPGLVRATCRIPANFLAEGIHTVLAAIITINPTEVHAAERDAVSFHVVDHTISDGARGEYVGDYGGVVRPLLDWDVDRADNTLVWGGS